MESQEKLREFIDLYSHDRDNMTLVYKALHEIIVLDDLCKLVAEARDPAIDWLEKAKKYAVIGEAFSLYLSVAMQAAYDDIKDEEDNTEIMDT